MWAAPAKEITGGPWYTDQEFDYEFVKHLSNYVLSYVKEQVWGLLNTSSIPPSISGVLQSLSVEMKCRKFCDAKQLVSVIDVILWWHCLPLEAGYESTS